jgi:1,5-anhydro-D-fructose reductase (1,5-anhydro-D-mannitol-forming)
MVGIFLMERNDGMTESIGWGLVGTSGWAETTFGPAIAAAENALLAGVVGSAPEKSAAYARKHGVKTAFDSLGQMAASDEIQAVWIASPNHLHAEQAIEALTAGAHVLVEKPMAISPAEGKRMAEAADKANRLLSVGYHIRHHPDHRRLQKDWMAGRFGKPIQMRAHLFFANPEPPPEWRQRKATSGDWVLGDIGTHLIDQLLWFLGAPAEVQGFLGSPRFGLESSDHGVVTIRFENGAVGIAEASVGSPGRGPAVELHGTSGFAIVEGTFFGGGGAITTGDATGKTQTREAATLNPYQAQVEAFGRAIAGDAPLAATPADGIRNLDVIQKARGW